jgi:hypothetical protein
MSGLVRAAHARGLRVDVWTVGEETDMRRLLGFGVDGVMTDRPDLRQATTLAGVAFTVSKTPHVHLSRSNAWNKRSPRPVCAIVRNALRGYSALALADPPSVPSTARNTRCGVAPACAGPPEGGRTPARRRISQLTEGAPRLVRWREWQRGGEGGLGAAGAPTAVPGPAS